VTPTDSLPNVINTILGQTAFETFGTSRPNQQCSELSQRPGFAAKGAVKGVLESNPHDNVHGFVGGLSGLMASSQSALDPIFMMHHCNIDRI
jgi:tyrosinase